MSYSLDNIATYCFNTYAEALAVFGEPIIVRNRLMPPAPVPIQDNPPEMFIEIAREEFELRSIQNGTTQIWRYVQISGKGWTEEGLIRKYGKR